MNANLCSSCSEITIASLTEYLLAPPVWWSSVNGRADPQGKLHYQTGQQLLESAKTCPLCQLMQNALVNSARNIGELSENELSDTLTTCGCGTSRHCLHQILADSPVYLAPKSDNVHTMWPEEGKNGAEMRGIFVYASTQRGKTLSGILRVWALPDSPAQLSGDVAGRPQLLGSGTQDAHERIAQWLQACINQHEECGKSLSGQVIDEHVDELLPARIIDVGQNDQGSNPRLLEAAGMRVPYVALSHCWGDRSKPPLQTKRATLETFKQAIPWQELPKTFQEAMTVTRALGLRFLWIDSLCIIQDDISDWKREAEKMGAVYEQAQLTIAASHAKNSHDGLFLARPPRFVPLELPYRDQDGRAAGTFMVSEYFTDFEAMSPENGMLNTRAWATQEWLLSRRMVFYTAHSIMWSCKTATQRETGERCRNTARNAKWKIVIEHYSARQLSQPGDKLIALEGLKNTLARKLGDEYVLGVWRQSLPDQLLWRVRTSRATRVNTLQLPTWSWASTEVAVRFLDIKKAKNNCAGFIFQDQSLIVMSRLKQIGSFVDLATLDDSGSLNSSELNPDWPDSMNPTTLDIPANLVVLLNDDSGNLLGWAVTDEPELPQLPLFCLLLMGKTTRGTRQRHVRATEISEDWVLILQERGSQLGSFVRVGAGKVYSTSWWDETPIRKVRIV